jgi:hypothetical protein
VTRFVSERKQAEIIADRGREIGGYLLLDVPGLRDDRMAVPLTDTGAVYDSHDPAGFRAALSCFISLFKVSPGCVLRRDTWAPPRSVNLCQWQGLSTPVLQRALDLMPTKWLTCRPALTSGTGLSARRPSSSSENT